MPELIANAARFYREIYGEARHWPMLALWWIPMLCLSGVLFLAENRWLHADVAAPAFASPGHSACTGYDSAQCTEWLDELDQRRREIAVRIGSCQIADQCPPPSGTEPLISAAPCAGNGGCSTDKTAWYKKAVCPASPKLWSKSELGVVRRLVVAKKTAVSCGGIADTMARPSLRELGLSPLVIYPLYFLVLLLLSPVFVIAQGLWDHRKDARGPRRK